MAFQQGLSGLNTSARALDVISNNISNAATVGFKGGQAQFSNVYAAALGVGGGSQIGIGASMSAVQQQFSQGNISNSNSPLDVAINGSGFFRLQKSTTDGTVTYTRNGQFHLDSSGYVINAQGNNLTGYNIVDGVVDRAKLIPVQLDTSGSKPQATGASSTNPGVKVQMNFDDRDLKSLASAAPNALYAWGANGTTFPPTNLNTFNYSTSLTVYDQKGNDHALSMYFTRLANSEGAAPARDLWQAHFVLDDKDITAAMIPATHTVGNSGKIPLVQFNSDGTINKGAPWADPTGAVTYSENLGLTGTTPNLSVNLNNLQFLPSFAYTAGASPTAGSYTSIQSVSIKDSTGTTHTFNPIDPASLNVAPYAGGNYYAVDPTTGVMSFDSAAVATYGLTTENVAITYNNGSSAFFTDYQFQIDTSKFPTTAPDVTNTTLYPLGASDPAYVADLATYNNWGKFGSIFGTDNTGTALKIPLSFDNSTMFGSGYDANKITQDGYPYGRLSGVAVSADGVLRGNYSNGQTKDISQLVLVDFISPVGLMNLGNNQWQETAASGQALVGDPGTGSRGVLQSSAVEDANIDLTQELVNLITFQRNYQANAQSIKTQDQVMQTIVNLR